jgi:hypothetical protein
MPGGAPVVGFLRIIRSKHRDPNYTLQRYFPTYAER